MEKFKRIDEILEPDPGTHTFHIFDESLGDFRQREIDDVHNRLKKYN